MDAQSTRSITLCTLLIALGSIGCHSAASSGLLTNRGITYVFTGAHITQQTINNGDVQVQTDAYTFQCKDNYVTLNGRRCGIVHTGDKVEVKGKGEVFINGLAR